MRWHILTLALLAVWSSPATAASPGILFIIADDASRSFGETNGCTWAKTPNIDRLAKAGLVFDNAYTPTSKCAPSRAAILTGRYPWQLEEAANHQPYFPTKYVAFSEAITTAGIACGGTGKTWGPGSATKADGSPRDFELRTAKKQGSPGERLGAFLEQTPDDKPFFFWFGSVNPHRPYAPDSGLQAGKKLEDIPAVPKHWPDHEVVRRDMLDYAVEIEAFDREVGSLLEALQESGRAQNTLVIVTSDHGMPFPRVKGHTIDDANHIPFVACWPEGITSPGRRVNDFINFVDLAPTFLEVLKVDGPAAGMQPLSGTSFVDVLKNSPARARNVVIIGRERNDVDARPGSPAGLGYPVRGIRQDNLLYIHNFEHDRWPCGDVDLGLKDTDDSPTKRLVASLGPGDNYWEKCFGKRPQEQMFDVVKDPDCVRNLAVLPEYQMQLTTLREQLMSELKKQSDPRVLGKGTQFDLYPSPRSKSAQDEVKASRKAQQAASRKAARNQTSENTKAEAVAP